MLAQVGVAHAATEAVAAGLRIEAEQIVAIKTALVRAQLADDSRRIEGNPRLLLPLKAPHGRFRVVAIVLIGPGWSGRAAARSMHAEGQAHRMLCKEVRPP